MNESATPRGAGAYSGGTTEERARSPLSAGAIGDAAAVPYRELPPPAALRDAIACFWVRTVAAGEPAARVLPDACVDLIWSAGRGAFIAGPDTGPVLTELRPGSVLVGARFLPGAGGPALGIPLSELRDARVDLAALDPMPRTSRSRGDRPHSRTFGGLGGELAPVEAVGEVARVASELVAAGPPDRAVRAAARALSDPRARVDRLAGALGLSERQLRRRCDAAVGYGPKALQRTLRFRRFLALGDAAGADADLAELAAQAGYADQAHLTREARRLSGLTPAALLDARAG